MEGKLSRFRFKGARDYIHGSDIFDVVDEYLAAQDLRVLTLSFRHFARCQLLYLTDNPGIDVKAEGVALGGDGKAQRFWLVEAPEPVTERYAFDEGAITERARIEGKVVEAPSAGGYSVIEQIIALTKFLNYALSPDVNGRWVFGQLRLRRPLPAQVGYYHIAQKAQVTGRFSVQEVVLDGLLAGEIRFIVSAP